MPSRAACSRHVVEVFAVEGIRGAQAQRRGAEHVGVARPAHALVALWAVGGGVEEVVPHSPACVADELVDLGVAGGYARALGVEVAVECNTRKACGVKDLWRGAVCLYPNVAVAVKREGRLHGPGLAAAHVGVLGPRRAQVVAIELPVLQKLTKLQADARPCRLLHPQAERPGDVLAQVKHAVSRGRAHQLRQEGLVRQHGQAQAIAEKGGRPCRGLVVVDNVIGDGAAVETGEETRPYAVDLYRYYEGSGLYICLGYKKDDDYYLFSDLLEILSYAGIGGKISSGYGRFTAVPIVPSKEFAKRLEGKNWKQYLSLSVCLPGREELDGVMQDANVRLCKRSGWVSPGPGIEQLRKRKDIYMFMYYR